MPELCLERCKPAISDGRRPRCCTCTMKTSGWSSARSVGPADLRRGSRAASGRSKSRRLLELLYHRPTPQAKLEHRDSADVESCRHLRRAQDARISGATIARPCRDEAPERRIAPLPLETGGRRP